MSDKSLSLYHIEEELKAYLDSEALVPEEQLAEFQAEFVAKSAAAVRKRGDCIRAISHIEAQIAGARAEENRIAAWRGSLESGLARFKDYLVRCIELSGQKKVEADNGSLAIQANPESVEITDLDQVPDEFKTVTVKMPAALYRELLQETGDRDAAVYSHILDVTFTADKVAIRKALKEGREVTGADSRFGKNRLVVK